MPNLYLSQIKAGSNLEIKIPSFNQVKNLHFQHLVSVSKIRILSRASKEVQILIVLLNSNLRVKRFSLRNRQFIILYLIIGFFSKLRMSMNYISYSAKKFNRAMYEL
jgi:hypothetical protein